MLINGKEVKSCKECQYFWEFEGDDYPCCSRLYALSIFRTGSSLKEDDEIEDHVKNGISIRCPFLGAGEMKN